MIKFVEFMNGRKLGGLMSLPLESAVDAANDWMEEHRKLVPTILNVETIMVTKNGNSSEVGVRVWFVEKGTFDGCRQ